MIDRFLLGGRWVLVVVCLGVVIGCTPSAEELGVSEAGAVTVATFEKIKKGMSIEEVEKVAPGGLQSWEPGWDSITYLEYNMGGATWIVAFQSQAVIEKGESKVVKEKVKEAVEAGQAAPKEDDEEE
jgi:hypothetical protein